MTTTPILGVNELASGQAVPETSVNEAVRYLEQGARHFVIVDRDLSTPAGGEADGSAYIVSGTGTGAWASHDGDIAFKMSTGWEFINVAEGMSFWIADENKYLVATSASTFSELAVGVTAYTDAMARAAVNIAPTTVSGTSYIADVGDAGAYLQFTNAASVAFTVPANATEPFAIGAVMTLEQAGAGVVTITPDTGVTLNSRGGLLDTAGQYAVAQVKKVATDTWTVIGDVA